MQPKETTMPPKIERRDDVSPKRGAARVWRRRVRRLYEQEIPDRYARAYPRRVELYQPQGQRGQVRCRRSEDDQESHQAGGEDARRRDRRGVSVRYAHGDRVI